MVPTVPRRVAVQVPSIGPWPHAAGSWLEASSGWVDGVLTPALGTRGGAVVAGFNTPNRMVLTRDARPGQAFDVAVFGINGPISLAPPNYIWVRTCTLDLYGAQAAYPAEAVSVRLEHGAAGVEAIVPDSAAAERVAGGFAI